MDLELEGRSILLNVEDVRVCAAVAESCLAEGANVVIASPDATVFVGVRSDLVKRYGLKIRCIREEFSSVEAINLIFDSIERWAPPINGVVVDWSAYENGPGAEFDAATANFEVLAHRSTADSSLLFIDNSTRFAGEFDSTDDAAFASLHRKVRDWTKFTNGRRRINLLCLQGALSGPASQLNVRCSQPRQFPQTIDEAVGMRVAFMMSSMSGFFRENVSTMA